MKSVRNVLSGAAMNAAQRFAGLSYRLLGKPLGADESVLFLRASKLIEMFPIGPKTPWLDPSESKERG